MYAITKVLKPKFKNVGTSKFNQIQLKMYQCLIDSNLKMLFD